MRLLRLSNGIKKYALPSELAGNLKTEKGKGRRRAQRRLHKFSKLLRSVLIPNKDGLPISAVEDEYYELRGKWGR